MRFQTPLILASALAAGSVAFAAERASDDDKYEIREIGEPENCIMRSSIRSTDVIDDQTIDFKMRNGDIYRNNLPNKCSGLGFEEAFSYKTSTNRLCNVDIIHVLSQTGGRLDTRGAAASANSRKSRKFRRKKAQIEPRPAGDLPAQNNLLAKRQIRC
ncbi:hypothetical protein [Sphingopyxis sp. BSNA05]|uniref:hypothetical protein n=1 Tax=Sphingopyxis sp. BSNA05 TaxID=1236614 RepID=UPI0020B6C48E|nr:hypothetical protein [Sphingopyxis sp. BSNA05]